MKKMEKIEVKTMDEDVTIGTKDVKGKLKLDYVWVQKHDGTKEFYRMKPKGAELQLTPEIFGKAVDLVCKNMPSNLDDLMTWVEENSSFDHAMQEAFEAVCLPLMQSKLYRRMF